MFGESRCMYLISTYIISNEVIICEQCLFIIRRVIIEILKTVSAGTFPSRIRVRWRNSMVRFRGNHRPNSVPRNPRGDNREHSIAILFVVYSTKENGLHRRPFSPRSPHRSVFKNSRSNHFRPQVRV